MIDLHMHTNMSDGSDSPLELLDKVEAAGCKVFSVTDHDDLRANAIILVALKKKNYAARFITGCEISSVFEGRNLHLLGYGFNPEADSMKQLIAEGVAGRRRRIIAMFDHLQAKHNTIISDNDKAEILSRAIPGKVHIADVILKLETGLSRQQIFDRYLNDMESREFKVPAERVIELVKRAGGVVSFAHPIEVWREYGFKFIDQMDEMMGRLKGVGLDAVEVFHSAHSEDEIAIYASLARKNNLLISGGSDYHGKNKDDVKIGQLTKHGAIYPSDVELTILLAFN